LAIESFRVNREQKRYAVLSQHLALDINSTAHVSTTPVSIYGAMLRQIANHMRVCVEIGQGTESIRGIAASEPILSEAASYVLRRGSGFDLAGALSDALSGFSINLGDRGELLVAAFFTLARDAVAKTYDNKLPDT
jgi:D-serine deaminase-like pyridoxal phosphate-dependent protein